MNKKYSRKNKGFTILETLIAVMLLSLVLNSVFTLISGTLFSAQYARNEMVASYLLQESADYIRNTRDTQSKVDPVDGWNGFLTMYDLHGSGAKSRACKLKIYPGSTSAPECSSPNGSNADSENIYFYKDTYLGNYYSTENAAVAGKESTTFTRSVILSKDNAGEEVNASIVINWKNGSNLKSKSYKMSLTSWQTN